MAAVDTSGTSERFTLDCFAFEKFLAAAWVLQCLHDQLHDHPVPSESIAEPVKTQEGMESASLVLPAAVEPTVQPILEVDRKPEVLSNGLADDKTLAELVDAQPAIETGTSGLDAANKPGSARHQSWFNPSAVSKGFADALANLRPALRVNLTLRALRAVAIAAPVLLLAVVAALLIYESWRHESLRSAQAFTTPNPPVEEVSSSKTANTAPRGLSANTRSGNTRKIDNEPWQTGPATPREFSHKRITELATSSVVQRLSRYEIRGLRRQAKYGDSSAAFTLGMAYEIGHFVPRNCVEAARWVTASAESGNAAAQYNLGLRYRDGDGVSADRTVSERWLRKAAHRNGKAKDALRMMASAQLHP
jgi:hypothetical protein